MQDDVGEGAMHFRVNRAKVEDKRKGRSAGGRKDAKALSIADGVADKVESSPLPPIIQRPRHSKDD